MVLVIFESKESEKTMTIQTKMLKKPLSLDKGGGYGKSSISLGALDLLGFLRIFPLPVHYQSSSSDGTMQGQPQCSTGVPLYRQVYPVSRESKLQIKSKQIVVYASKNNCEKKASISYLVYTIHFFVTSHGSC